MEKIVELGYSLFMENQAFLRKKNKNQVPLCTKILGENLPKSWVNHNWGTLAKGPIWFPICVYQMCLFIIVMGMECGIYITLKHVFLNFAIC